MQVTHSRHSVDATMSVNSGQTFLWEHSGSDWYGIDGQRVLKFSHDGQLTRYSSYPETPWVSEFFRLDDDTNAIHESLAHDRLISKLLEKYPGLRLIRQDPEQCVFSFLCASNTNIPMIRRMLRNLTRRAGEKVEFDGKEFYTFPTSEAIAKVPMRDLIGCGLGYRARAIKEAAEKIAAGVVDLRQLKTMEYGDAKGQLLGLYGIGEKIADCILLFSLEKLEAFPVDVWIARSLARNYGWLRAFKIGEKMTSSQYRKLSEMMREHFGRYAGYAQQLLYYDIRQSSGLCW